MGLALTPQNAGQMIDRMLPGGMSKHFRPSVVLLLLLFAMHVWAQPKPAAKPWEGKDWRQWTAKECKQVLEDSPWARIRISESSTQATRWVRAQFRSALPVRQALARQILIKKGYDKAGVARKLALEKEVESQIAQDFSDKILIHIEYGVSGAWEPIGNSGQYDENGHWVPGSTGYRSIRYPETGEDAILMFATNRRISAIRRTAEHKRQFEIHFPRTMAGQPVILPDSPRLSLMLLGANRTMKLKKEKTSSQNVSPETVKKVTEALEFALTVRQRIEFEPAAMLYQGRLEY